MAKAYDVLNNSDKTFHTVMKHLINIFDDLLLYIDNHLEHDLSLPILSEQMGLSKFHFHRLFSSYVGISAKQYIQQKRLNRACYQLVFRQNMPITEVAYQAKFKNCESFSRAFKSTFNQTPSEYKMSPQSKPWLQAASTKKSAHSNASLDSEIDIVEFPETHIASLVHIGSPNKMMATVQQFIAWRMKYHTPPSQSKTFNLLYDNPSHVEDSEFRFEVCAETTYPIKENEFNVTNKTIPFGKCAKLRHFGADNLLEQSLHTLYEQWLPNSGETVRDYPCILERVKMYPEVPESQAIIDIYLPLI